MSRSVPVASAPPMTEEMQQQFAAAQQQVLYGSPGARYGSVPYWGGADAAAAGASGLTVPLAPRDEEAASREAVAVPPPRYQQLQYDPSYSNRIAGWADQYFTPVAKQRAASAKAAVDSLTTGWGYFVVTIFMSLYRTHQLRGLTVTDGTVAVGDFSNVVNHLLRDLLVLSSVFVLHKVVHAHGSHSRGERLKENALHSPEIVDHSRPLVRKHDSWRLTHGRVSTAFNLASMAVLGYAAFRFAIGDPNHAKDNLNLLGGSMALEFVAGVAQCWSEQRRTKSINPDLPADIAIKGKSLAIGVASLLGFVAASVVANSNTGDHYSYDRTLISALLCTVGAGLVTSITQRAGAEMTAAAVASKFEDRLDPKVNRGELPLGFCSVSTKESTRQRLEEILFKAMLFGTIFCTKRYDSLVPVVAGIVGVSVASMLIGKSREVRGANAFNRIQQARQGIEPTAGMNETTRTLTCCR